MKQILYFTAAWCGPCKMLAPRMEKISNQINYRKIDVDSESSISSQYGIRSVPTLVLLENGVVKNKLVGLKSEQEIINFYNG
jgi:thioredoxin 1